MHNFLELELRFAREKLLAYENDHSLRYRPEYIQQLLHVIEYLTGRVDELQHRHDS